MGLGAVESELSKDSKRIQAEQLVNCIVVTGQESVEGSSRRMREDLYKKHMSSDPVAARLPYAIITKQVGRAHHLGNSVHMASVTRQDSTMCDARSLSRPPCHVLPRQKKGPYLFQRDDSPIL